MNSFVRAAFLGDVSPKMALDWRFAKSFAPLGGTSRSNRLVKC